VAAVLAGKAALDNGGAPAVAVAAAAGSQKPLAAVSAGVLPSPSPGLPAAGVGALGAAALDPATSTLDSNAAAAAPNAAANATANANANATAAANSVEYHTSYLTPQINSPNYTVADYWDNWSPGSLRSELEAFSGDVFEQLPRSFLRELRNPCWGDLRGELKCLPYYHILGVSKCGTTDLYNRLAKHPDVLASANKVRRGWGGYGARRGFEP
jgi:hypothetical protein